MSEPSNALDNMETEETLMANLEPEKPRVKDKNVIESSKTIDLVDHKGSSLEQEETGNVLRVMQGSYSCERSRSIVIGETNGETDEEEESREGLPTDVKSPYSELVNIVNNKLENLHQLPYPRTIFRVPERLRELNEKAFTPRVVSIGPLHHGKENLKAMEEHKRRYVRDFFRFRGASLEECVKLIKTYEKTLRDYYVESIKLSSDEFVEMILVDGIFLIELFLGYENNEFGIDCIFSTPNLRWDIRYDLCLLENQIPYFILVDLFKLAKRNTPSVSMIDLILKFGKWELDFPIIEDRLKECSFISHIVDLLAYGYQPSKENEYKGSMKVLNIPRAMELHQAGVKLELLESSKNFFDIKFEGSSLKIPRLRVGDSARTVWRNLLAYEQCHCAKKFIAEYVVFMNYLLRSAEDVDLLVERDIIENWLQCPEDVSTLFKELAQDMIFNTDDYLYGRLVDQLNDCRNIWWRKSLANLKQNYFNTPWAALSVIAAILLLILTIIQTVCTILQV